jgi:polar amino acid transport system substrate-binding protein
MNAQTPIRVTLVAAALIGTAAAPAAVIRPLRLCADPVNMPFSSNASAAQERGAPGLYIEIGRLVADALGRPMETVWSLSYFGKRNLRSTLLAGQCDLAVGLPADPELMGTRVIFTRPILTVGYALAFPRSQAIEDINGLKGKRVAVQFATPPQSLLATMTDVTSVTTMDPEEGMRRLAAGEVDAAFIWGPNAGYINHTALRDKFIVIPVKAPQMQWQAAIGVSSKQPALRDEVDSALGRLASEIRKLSAKYALPADPSPTISTAALTPIAVSDTETAPVRGDRMEGDVGEGKEIFNGTCAHCHGPNAVVADRKIDLRRLGHKYGEQMEDVFFTTVTNGRPAKGMPAWKDAFKEQDFVNILSYLKTVQEK